MYIVQCIDYIGYSTRTLCAVCEDCSVFAMHYKYIVEGLRKTIKMYKDYRSLVLKEILWSVLYG